MNNPKIIDPCVEEFEEFLNRYIKSEMPAFSIECCTGKVAEKLERFELDMCDVVQCIANFSSVARHMCAGVQFAIHGQSVEGSPMVIIAVQNGTVLKPTNVWLD